MRRQHFKQEPMFNGNEPASMIRTYHYMDESREKMAREPLRKMWRGLE